MARVAMVFTGGTISMGFDPVAGGNVPALDGAAILARTPGLETIADIVTVDRGLTPASHFTFEDVLEIGRAVQESLDEPSIDGVVVVQGTDTIEETSFAWDLVLRSAKPVVVTGAMRAPHEADFDGPANLRDAVAAAVSPELRDAGVVVTLAGTLEPADDVTKLHTTAFTTFGSPNGGTLGRVADGRVVFGAPLAGLVGAWNGFRQPVPESTCSRRGSARTGRCWMRPSRPGPTGSWSRRQGPGTRRPAGWPPPSERWPRASWSRWRRVARPGRSRRRTRSRAAARRGSAPARSGSGRCARSRPAWRWPWGSALGCRATRWLGCSQTRSGRNRQPRESPEPLG